MIHHDIPVRPWDVIGADMFTLTNKHYLYIVDYHRKFLIVKKTEDLSTDRLILTCKIIFAEYGIPKKLMSDSGGNFISDKFKTFCKSLNIEQAFSSLYLQQSNRQVEAHIKFVKHTLKKCFDSRGDPHIGLLQILSTLVGQGLPSPKTILFNYPIKDKDTSNNFASFPIGSTVVAQWEDGGPWNHGTIKGKLYQNHHDISYHICITKTGGLVT